MEDAAVTTRREKAAGPAMDAVAVVEKKTRTTTIKNVAVLQGVAVSPPWIQRNAAKLLARVEKPRMEVVAMTTRKKKQPVRQRTSRQSGRR